MSSSLATLCVSCIVESHTSVPLLTPELHELLLHGALASGKLELVPSLSLVTTVSLRRPIPSFPFQALRHFRDLTRLELVDQNLAVASLSELLGEGPSQVRVLDLSGNPRLRDPCFAGLAKLTPQLEELAVNDCRRLSHVALCGAVHHCQELWRLSCEGVRLNSEGFAEMCGGARARLRVLRIARAKLNDECVAALCSFSRSLEELALLHCFTLTSTDFLSALPRLSRLDVSGCAKLSSVPSAASLLAFRAEFCDGLRSVDGLCPSLQVLELAHLKNLEAVPALQLVSTGFPALCRLRLQSSVIILRDPFLIALRNSCGASLIELQLSTCLFNDEGMRALGSGFPVLEIAHLAGTWNEGTDDAFALVSRQCPRLRSLSVGKLSEHATDEAFVRVCNLPALELLDLNLHHLTDEALRRAAPLPHALALSLRYCRRLTADALALLASKAPLLQSLDVSQCMFDSAAIVAFLRQTPVKFVNVSGLAIPESELAAMTAQFPHVQIFR
jgi:hypothetical protein